MEMFSYQNAVATVWVRLDSKMKHREDGPAVEFYDGSMEWWFNGYQLEHLCRQPCFFAKIEDVPSRLWEAMAEIDLANFVHLFDDAPEEIRNRYRHLVDLVEVGVL